MVCIHRTEVNVVILSPSEYGSECCVFSCIEELFFISEGINFLFLIKKQEKRFLS